MIELIVLKVLLNRDIYLRYRSFISVSKELLPVLECLDNWYKNNTVSPTLSDLAVSCPKGYPQEALGRLQSLDLPKDVPGLLQRVKTAQIASNLAMEAYKLSEEESSVAKVVQMVEELQRDHRVDEVGEFVTRNLREILNQTVSVPGLRWRLNWLNRSLGSIRKGDLGIIFARPETGKTSFLASEVTFMATQAEHQILWFNNEERGEKVALRCYQASLGATTAQISSHAERAELRYRENTKDLIRIVDDAGISARKVEAIVAQVQPALIVFDQLDKIHGFKNDREDLALGAIYQWARELAKAYSPILGVCQASGDAEGEPWLHMGHMSNAKTAKQAEADFILGIGKIHQPGHDYIRYLNISKNKLLGDADTDPAMRHGRAEVLIRPEIARYEEA
jgi:hypothetical protein